VRSLPRQPSEDQEQEEPSRKDIAASLAQKDPTWFKQTEDRGLASAAFRKNQVEDTPEGSTARRMQLPGMSRSREPSKSPAPDEGNEQFHRQSGVDQKDVDRFKRGNTPDIAALRNSMIEKPPSLRPTRPESTTSWPTSLDTSIAEEGTSELTRSSSTLSQNRPVSPTKGLGGFVESAMMRRSDSMNKRWSVKANTGLNRGDSVAGGRPISLHSRGMSREVPSTRGDTPSSPLTSSRPGSSHNMESAPSPVAGKRSSREASAKATDASKNEPSTPPLSAKVEQPAVRPQTPTDNAQLARSPSKTMDTRRWSPTKSTWLESALQQKSEPPKLQPTKEEQPKWKVDLQRSKSQRASRDVSPEKHQQAKSSAIKDTPTASMPALKSQAKPAATTASTLAGKSTPPPVTAELPPREPITQKEERLVSKVIKHDSSEPDQVKEEPKTEAEKPEEVSKAALADSSKKAPLVKPKPQTPPKTDFRATLKSRTTGPEQNTGAEPEFKAVFGKLKRTTTQNYIAPDDLKHNILSGKAALNLTGGPVRTKRPDEFRESILAKKEEMKTATVQSPQRPESKEKMDAPVPEALARRKTLSKATAPDLAHLRSASQIEPPQPAAKPQIAAKVEVKKSELNVKKPSEGLPKKPSSLPTAEATTSQQIGGVESTKPLVGQSQPLRVRTSKPLDSLKSGGQPDMSASIRGEPSSSKMVGGQTTVRSPEASTLKSELPPANQLASRLNPKLAAMLSRGPSPGQGPSASTDDLSLIPSALSTKKDGGTGPEAGSLTHMTKGRAKGPKRRAPKPEPASTIESVPAKNAGPVQPPMSNPLAKHSTPTIFPTSAIAHSTPAAVSTVAKSPVTLSPKSVRAWGSHNQNSTTPAAVPLQDVAYPQTPSFAVDGLDKSAKEEQSSQEIDKSSDTSKLKPAVASKSPELRKVSSPPSIDEKKAPGDQLSTPRKPGWSPAPRQLASTGTASPTKLATTPLSETSEDVKTPTRSTTADAQIDEKPPRPTAAVAKPIAIQGLGLKMSPLPQMSKSAPKTRVLTPPPDMDRRKSPSHQPQEIKHVLEGYVGVLQKEHDKADFDAQQFLASAKAADDKIKTLQCTTNEITGDGKKTAMPPQQDHILYEECMYLITHKFSNEAGATASEVYLWRGDRVADASVEDAQIFCRRDAREQNAKLEIVKQGKESSRLIQALGGILIARRSKSSTLYMLCGRRHLGHIVFDEVEMDASNLCPGFAYLISAPFGKLYLWKGKGAGVDEISSAKLIGMDLGLTGGIEEMEQGSEPSSFWAALGSKPKTTWSNNWHQRATMNGFPTALYRVEHERPGMLTNLASWGLKRAASPAKQPAKATCERLQSFTQNDLDVPAIHILDAYSTLYILLTRQCASKASELITALYLAQDFAMLSPAIQDRPTLPACYVVAGEMTNDVKACFRKWSALEGNSLVGKDSICVRLEEVMEALNL